eukprot:CAMPEP_0117523464 /NCGR_PEP_ID=MMETSP0784-20121206/34741_1 /TAXON_ID=39447 /ORGANISM="" /LENGTH=46 /DNA_ID= /DNA_START= /DNA_END= /DNA_ORIENTATION=
MATARRRDDASGVATSSKAEAALSTVAVAFASMDSGRFTNRLGALG